MDKREALAERARLQNLLEAYESDRRTEDERRGVKREVTPDRAGNVRARIARLDRIIIEDEEAQRRP